MQGRHAGISAFPFSTPLRVGKKVADAARKLVLDLAKALPQPPKTARSADMERRSKIRIISAFYGQNVSWLDVTDRVRQATKGKPKPDYSFGPDGAGTGCPLVTLGGVSESRTERSA